MSVIRQIYSFHSTVDSDLDRLFKIYYDRLVFFAWKIINDKQQAEDTAQDAFISYWQQRENVASHPVAIKNFLYSTVRNACLNIIRHAQVVGAFEAIHSSAEPAEAYILEAIISAELIAELHQVVQTLPEHLQIVSKLSFLEGKKNQEVADELNMSVNTVKKQKQRALELLRMRLNPETFLLLLSCGGLLFNK